MMTKGPYAIGLDIGGTFTDLILLDATGGTQVHKLLSTPDNPAEAALRGVSELLGASGVPIEEIELLVHSTTLVTNALTQPRGAVTGLIGTRGFRDILEMRNEHRYDIYDLFLEWPPSLVPRERRMTINERVTRDGTVLIEPDEADIKSVVDRLLVENVEAIAICLLHSYKNPANEERVAEVVRRLAPGVPVTVSSEIAPVIREYERTSTAVADAYVRPLTDTYLSEMADGLQSQGFAGNFYLMLSGGGSASVAAARRYPIRLVESGPAAGALAAGLYGKLTDNDQIISFDMGGTTAKLCLLTDGRPSVVNTLEVGRTRRFMRGSGMPVVIPSIELIEIGAGGGSIARVDAMGLLKVGPGSAGVDPGPVCYGFGGTEPTVTDANLVLGFLDPEYFLGGRFELDLTATTEAFARLGAEGGMSATETAWGVHQVVNENMAQAARMHLQERNVDPRKVCMVAFGGAGPAHAASIARLLGTSRVIYPLGAGATSALGCLVAPLSFQFTRSAISILEEQDWGNINEMYADMKERGYASLGEAGIGKDQIEIMLEADLRVYGQLHELTVSVPNQVLDADVIGVLKASFAKVYRQMYSRYNDDFLIESVNWKMTARGPNRNVELRMADTDSGGTALKKYRDVFLSDEGEYGSVPVYDRYLLPIGAEIHGPAIVEERETTVNLPSGSIAVVDQFGNLVANLAARSGGTV